MKRPAKAKDNAISAPSLEQCECCGKFKVCRMYVTHMGTASWVCTECRVGNTS